MYIKLSKIIFVYLKLFNHKFNILTEWTKEETIEALLKKAGVKSRLSQSLKDSIRLTRYRSEKVEMSFEVSSVVMAPANSCLDQILN